MRQIGDLLADGLRRLVVWFITASPAVFAVGVVVVFVFVAGTTLSVSLGTATTLTLSFLTGVDSPANHALPLDRSGRWMGWAVTVVGWLIIPTSVAALLGFGERRIQRQRDLEFELLRLAQRTNLAEADQRRFVEQVIARRNEWLPPKV